MQSVSFVVRETRRGVGVASTRPVLLSGQLHGTNESPKQRMMNVHTNAIRCWITGVIYCRAETGGVHCILNFVITRTLVGLF
jgi:hypothetical protein